MCARAPRQRTWQMPQQQMSPAYKSRSTSSGSVPQNAVWDNPAPPPPAVSLETHTMIHGATLFSPGTHKDEDRGLCVPPPPSGRRFPPTPGGTVAKRRPPPPTPPTTYRCILCRIHGWSVACCRLSKDLGYTLTCIDADGAMHIMQTSKILNALHPFIIFLPAPSSEQGQCKTSSYSPT